MGAKESLRTLLQKHHSWDRLLFIAGLDIETAFDQIEACAVEQDLRAHGVLEWAIAVVLWELVGFNACGCWCGSGQASDFVSAFGSHLLKVGRRGLLGKVPVSSAMALSVVSRQRLCHRGQSRKVTAAVPRLGRLGSRGRHAIQRLAAERVCLGQR